MCVPSTIWPGCSSTSPRCDASMVLEWLEKSIQGTSGALRGFGAAGVVLARAVGHGSAAAASRLASSVPISWLTACRCSVLHRGCVRAQCDVCSSSMAADRWPTSIPCRGTSLMQRRPVGCALVSHGAAACVKYGHSRIYSLYKNVNYNVMNVLSHFRLIHTARLRTHTRGPDIAPPP